MHAADLFEKQVLYSKPHKILKHAANKYWIKVKPPYKTQDLFTIAITFFISLTIPITVFVANQVRDHRGQAASGQIAVFEENFKKLDLKFAAKEQKLTLIKKVDDDTLPQPEIDKKGEKNLKALTFEVKQTNKIGQPIFSSSQDVIVEVNGKGEALGKDVYFSVQVPDEQSTVTVILAGKKLLEVGI